MDIKDLTLKEISDKLKHYLTCYFTDSQLMEHEDGMFEESVLLYHDEIRHLIPIEHRECFNDEDEFHAASGIIRFLSKGDQFKSKDYIIMLLYDDTHTLFLYLHEQDNTNQTHQDILLVDFLK